MYLTEENSDNHIEEEVADDDNSPFRNGGIRDRRMIETSLRDIENNPTHIAFTDLSMPSNSDSKTNPPKKSEKNKG